MGLSLQILLCSQNPSEGQQGEPNFVTHLLCRKKVVRESILPKWKAFSKAVLMVEDLPQKYPDIYHPSSLCSRLLQPSTLETLCSSWTTSISIMWLSIYFSCILLNCLCHEYPVFLPSIFSPFD